MTLSITGILILFALYAFLLADIFAISFHKPYLRWVLGKPELMPILALFYWYNAPEINPFIMAALFFGWIGDLFLLKKEKTVYFLAGTAAFLWMGRAICTSPATAGCWGWTGSPSS